MDLQPPDVEVQDGKPVFSKDEGQKEGVAGWISNMVKRTKGDAASASGSGTYRRIGQEDE